MTQNKVRGVLFDLDDTLFDHQHSCRTALQALQQTFHALMHVPLAELEKTHAYLLEKYHQRVVRGHLTLNRSREERFRELLGVYGELLTATTANRAATLYSQVYLASRRATPGAIPLLKSLKPLVKTAIVTNHLVAEQLDKLRVCQMTDLLDELIISEEIGTTKPDPAIFLAALKRIACEPDEVIMIGDSWETDILGATNLGISTFWLNRYARPCPDPTLVTEIHALEPLEPLLAQLLNHADLASRRGASPTKAVSPGRTEE